MKERLSIRVDPQRLEKLRRIAKQKRKTMTQLIEDWIDRLQEEKSPAYGRGFKPSFLVMIENTSIFSKVRALLGVPYC
jgi:hypothetical protein